jgi:hypothetical protein
MEGCSGRSWSVMAGVIADVGEEEGGNEVG